MKKRLILDTSVFVNPASAHFFGNSPTSALIGFLELAAGVPGVEFLMPPSIYTELMHFVDEGQVPKKLLLLLHKKPPNKHEVKIPGIFLYTLVENMRDRVDRGLRLSERHVREALQRDPVGAEARGSRSSHSPDSTSIAQLRESYRRIMREGMLDSKADVDLLLLAYESESTLVSADEGILTWAENLGISMLSSNHLRTFLQQNSSEKQV